MMNIISEGEAVVSSRRQTSRLVKMVGRTDAIFVGLGFDACSRSATLDSASSNSEGQLGDNPGWTPVDLVGVAGQPVAPPTPTATLTETATSTAALTDTPTETATPKATERPTTALLRTTCR